LPFTPPPPFECCILPQLGKKIFFRRLNTSSGIEKLLRDDNISQKLRSKYFFPYISSVN
jgi:hypothetical protein